MKPENEFMDDVVEVPSTGPVTGIDGEVTEPVEVVKFVGIVLVVVVAVVVGVVVIDVVVGVVVVTVLDPVNGNSCAFAVSVPSNANADISNNVFFIIRLIYFDFDLFAFWAN